jgi:hypothetical protein
MKESHLIQRDINSIPKGKPFSALALCQSHAYSYDNTRQVLSRLLKAGEILRASPGIYVRPKEVAYLGKVLPQPDEILKLISKQTNEVLAIHGAEAARMLQLTTQVPMQPIFHTTGTTRTIIIGNQKIILRHIAPSKIVKPGTTTCLVISALWYLGKNHVNTEVIKKIRKQISAEQFNELLKHLYRMPAWMRQEFNQSN